MPRQILHVDMDEFFAAVEKLDNPAPRGKCLLVGGSPQGRGVVATASYEARRYGCHSAMPMSQALRLCPDAIVVSGNYRRYSQVSAQVFDILEQFTPLVEPLSIDEAFLDVTGSRRLLGEAPAIARAIKDRIRSQVGLTASVGVAACKFLAKLGSDLKKPDGLVVITEQGMRSTLDPLPITKIWGIGPSSAKQLQRLGVTTIGQLARMKIETVREVFGDSGEHWWKLAHGIDDRPVTCDGQAKSIGQEQTFAENVADLDELRGVLLEQVEQVARRLRRAKLRARTVTLKIRYGDFTTLSRSRTLREPTDLTEELWRNSLGILEDWARGGRRALRLLGMTASNLADTLGQLPLFEDAGTRKLHRLDQTLDDITRRFGQGCVRRAGGKGRGPRQE